MKLQGLEARACKAQRRRGGNSRSGIRFWHERCDSGRKQGCVPAHTCTYKRRRDREDGPVLVPNECEVSVGTEERPEKRSKDVREKVLGH